jgi:hypothetical protein
MHDGVRFDIPPAAPLQSLNLEMDSWNAAQPRTKIFVGRWVEEINPPLGAPMVEAQEKEFEARLTGLAILSDTDSRSHKKGMSKKRGRSKSALEPNQRASLEDWAKPERVDFANHSLWSCYSCISEIGWKSGWRGICVPSACFPRVLIFTTGMPRK